MEESSSPLHARWSCPRLIGRDAELEILEAGLASPPGLVLLTGESGVGKTRLLRELAARAVAASLTVLWARPESVAQPGAYSVIVDLLESVAVNGFPGWEEARQLSDLLSASEVIERGPPARRIAAQTRGVIGQTRARLLLLEDLHRADELSLAVVAHLARSAISDGVFLVASYRSEEFERSRALQRLVAASRAEGIVHELALNPLTHAQMTEMLQALWGQEFPLDRAAEVLRLSEGIPFFVEELARSWEMDARIPQSITHSVKAWLDELAPEARQVIAVASLLRGRLHTALLAEVCGLSDMEVVQALGSAVRLGILEDVDRRLGFRHALLRDAIADLWVSVERAEMHRHIARTMEKRLSEAGDHWAEYVADHYLASGDTEQAVPYLLRAGQYALSSGALDEARSRYQLILSQQPSNSFRGAALLGLGEALGRSGFFDEAQSNCGEAFQIFEALGDVPNALEAVHAQAKYGGAALDPQTLSALDNGFRLVSDENSIEHARLVVHKGELLVRRFQRLAEGAPLLEEGRELAQRLKSDVLLCEVFEGLAWVAGGRGDTRAAASHGGLACDLAVKVGDENLRVRTQHNQALRLANYGKGVDALELLDEVRARLVRMGSPMLAASDHLRAVILWMLGRPAAAEHVVIPLEPTRHGAEYGRVIGAWAAAEQGRDWIAESIVERWWDDLGGDPARARAVTDDRFFLEQASQVVLCEFVVAAHTGVQPSPRSFKLFQKYCEAAREETPEVTALARALMARVLLKQGLTGEAMDTLGFIEDSEMQGYPIRLGIGLELRGAARDLLGDREGAMRDLRSAVDLLSSAENVSDLVRCRRVLAEQRMTAGERAESLLDGLTEARKAALDVGADKEANRIEAVMRSLGARPRAGRPKGSGVKRGELTRREEEIVALVAAGASNAEIGSRLFISGRTVENHIARAHKRLSVSGRAGLAAWAAKNGLI